MGNKKKENSKFLKSSRFFSGGVIATVAVLALLGFTWVGQNIEPINKHATAITSDIPVMDVVMEETLAKVLSEAVPELVESFTQKPSDCTFIIGELTPELLSEAAKRDCGWIVKVSLDGTSLSLLSLAEATMCIFNLNLVKYCGEY